MISRKKLIDRLIRQLTLTVFFVFAAFFSGVTSAATSVSGGLSFDHNTTGFFLDGAHAKETCESCHIQGQFRGTPRDCATCHRPGGRSPGKTATHVPTTTACDACHGNITWAPSNFQHRTTQGIVQGACNTCHNGGTATGKPSTHVQTSSSCDSCHKTSSWLPAGYTHALVAPGTCATCHNGTRATGKPATHIPTTASCDSCHAAG
ncbi:cytochrome c3 family protein, partial [Sulfurirhabdus autotrophica]